MHWLVNLTMLVVAGDRTGDLNSTVATALAALAATAAFAAVFTYTPRGLFGNRTQRAESST